MKRGKLILFILFVIIFNISSIEISLKNHETISGELLDIQNGKYFVKADEVLFVIKSSVIRQIDESNPQEMNLIYAGGKSKKIDYSKYKQIIRIPQKRNSLLKLKLSLGLEIFGKNTTESESSFADTSFTKDVEPGYSVSAEVFYEAFRKINLGIGTTYQFPRKVKKVDGSEFQFLPIYAVGSYKIYSPKTFDFFVIARFGYNFFADKPNNLFKDNGGKLFWNAGIDCIFAERYLLNISYQINYQGKKTLFSNDKLSNQYRSLGINFGIIIL